MKTDENTVDQLHFLIERCNDGAKGYSYAGNAVDDVPLRMWLFAKAEQRKKFAEELNQLALRYGGDTEGDSTFLGKLHRQWLAFKSEVVSDSAEEVLEECIRGEEKAAADYRRIIVDHDLPAEAEAVVRRQLAAIREARAELEAKEEMLDARD